MPLKTELTNDGDLDTSAGATIDLAETGASAAGGPDATAQGPLLDLPPKEAARRVVAMRKLRSRLRQRRFAEAMRVVYWRKGYRFVTLTGDEDRGNWRAVLPVGSAKLPPNPNKVDRLLRRVTSVVTSDPPLPNCIPARDDDRAIAAAEFATRVLKVEGSSLALNLPRLLRRAMDKSMTHRSGIPYFYVDPQGGGHRPKAMLAHPGATSYDDATQDPMTGEDAPAEALTERFLMADGTLTDDATQAAPQWLPRVKVKMLTPQHVDFIPDTAESIDDAMGATIQLYCPLGELRVQFPDAFAALTPAELTQLVTWKPEDWKSYLPRDLRNEWQEPKVNKQGGYDDEVIVFPTFTYYKQHGEYPKGAFVVTVGDLFRLHAEPWCRDVELPDGETVTEYLELPLAQCRCLDDDVDDDPMGLALGEKLGPMDEIRATILGYALDYLFRFGNPQPYLPIGTTVQPKQLKYRTGDPIMVPPNSAPFYETVPEFPHKITELSAEMSGELDDESNLQQAAQGVEDPSVQSGIHAATIVEQSNIALSQIKENAGDCYKRMCRIVLQLFRVFYDLEQQIDYEGEDGAWKRDSWIGTDLGSTKVVDIQRGSFTMTAPSQKQAMAGQWLEAGVLKPDQYEELVSNSIAPTLGVQDNPDRKRIMGQLALWRKGPTPADVQAFEQYQLAQQQAQAAEQMAGQQAQRVAQATGAPQPVAAAPQLPPLVLPGDPFATDQRACDQEQDAAAVRHLALRRTMSSKAYLKPKFWQDALVAEYERMRQAAGIMTLAEQSAANAQAAQLKLEIAQTPKVSVIDKSASSDTIGADIAATQQAFHPQQPGTPAGPAAPVAPAAPAA